MYHSLSVKKKVKTCNQMYQLNLRNKITKNSTFSHAIKFFIRNYISTTGHTSALHSYYETSFQNSVYSCNKAIDKSIKSGSLASALKQFEEMPIRDVVSWNLIISGYSRFGFSRNAMCVYNDMIRDGFLESASTFSMVLSICSENGFYSEGVEVHSRVLVTGLSSNVYVGSSLVGIYMCMSLVDIAMKLFNDLAERNLATWNLMFRGLCELGRSNELLKLYIRMKSEGVDPNGLSFCYLISCCGKDWLFIEGEQLHCCVVKLGWLLSNIFVANALVDFYSASGCLYGVRISFEAIPDVDVISWNSVVSIYAEKGFTSDALEMFNKMQTWGKRPSARSVLGLVGLSSRTRDLALGKQIHCCVSKMGFDFGCLHVRSALIDMYGKSGEIESSVKLFNGINERSNECCNSLMTVLLHCDLVEDVFEMFGLIIDEGISFDEVSLSTTLNAVSLSNFKSLASCMLVHCCAIKSGYQNEIVVSTSLIDAYSKCGFVVFSRKVFDEVISPNLICFTSIISGYARNGMAKECLKIFDTMIKKGIKPDQVTFLSLLTGCNHSGLVEDGKMVFKSMKNHDIDPNREHYLCLVDLLGRAGLLLEAEDMLKLSPFKSDPKMWSSLVRSCRLHKNETVGKRAAEVLLELKLHDYIALFEVSRFYSEICDFENSVRIKELGIARKAREIGYSSIEINECVNL